MSNQGELGRIRTSGHVRTYADTECAGAAEVVQTDRMVQAGNPTRRIADLKAEAFDQNVEAEHVGIERRDAVGGEVRLLANGAGNDLVFQRAHELVERGVEVRAEGAVLDTLEDAAVPCDVGGVSPVGSWQWGQLAVAESQ